MFHNRSLQSSDPDKKNRSSLGWNAMEVTKSRCYLIAAREQRNSAHWEKENREREEEAKVHLERTETFFSIDVPQPHSLVHRGRQQKVILCIDPSAARQVTRTPKNHNQRTGFYLAPVQIENVRRVAPVFPDRLVLENGHDSGQRRLVLLEQFISFFARRQNFPHCTKKKKNPRTRKRDGQ